MTANIFFALKGLQTFVSYGFWGVVIYWSHARLTQHY